MSTFEKLFYNTPEVARVIRREASRASRTFRCFGLEPEDIRQEFALQLLENCERHDPSRSSPATFASHSCRFRTLQIVESSITAKRNFGRTPASLSAPAGR
jgi:hypothetical protein